MVNINKYYNKLKFDTLRIVILAVIMKKILFTLLLLLPLISCKSGKTSADEYAKAFIIMERTGCHGRCPIYKITINGTGKAVYEGKEFVTRKGLYEKQLTKKEISSLFSSFEKASFFDFNSEYTGPMTDLPGTFITYQNNHEIKKTIKDFWEPPQELKKLEKLVDEVANSDGWTTLQAQK